jgi:hypothetical protein
MSQGMTKFPPSLTALSYGICFIYASTSDTDFLTIVTAEEEHEM